MRRSEGLLINGPGAEMQINKNPLTESATWLRRLVVLSGTLVYTVVYSLAIILNALFGRLDRARADHFVREWAISLLRLVRTTVTVQGEVPDFSDNRRYIVLSTHASHYDIPVSLVALPGSIRMIAKKELFSVPLLGSAMKAAGFPSLDRSNRERAVADLAVARKLMEEGVVIWASPEGTRSPDGQLLPFKKGCFHLALDTEAVIIPVAIRGIHQVLPARSWQINLNQPVEVRIGEFIDTQGLGKSDLPALMARVRQSMGELLGDGYPGSDAPSAHARDVDTR